MAIYTMAMLVITRGYNLHFPMVFLWFFHGSDRPWPSPYPAVPRLAPSRQSDEYADKAEELVAFQEKLSEGGVQTQRPKNQLCGASNI